MKKYDKVVIKASDKAGKKMMATFSNSKGGRTKTIHFGQAGADDYTKTKDKSQRARYISRHRGKENWSVPDTAGSLSKHILWGASTSRRENINTFKRRFGLK